MVSEDEAKNYIELSLWECGREICIPNKIFHFTSKTYHLFHYVTAGKGSFELNGKSYKIHKGMIFYIPPHGDPHYSPDPEDPWAYEWLGFDGAMAASFLKLSGISSQDPVFFDETMALKSYFDAIFNEYSSKGKLDLYCLGQAYCLFSSLISHHGGKEASLTSKETHLTAAKDFILNNYQFDISVNDVASNVGVTPNYLAAVFQELEHSSTKSYLTQVRMAKAKLLLATGQYRIKDVAEMVGYKNQLHFSSQFHKYYGKTPSEMLGGIIG
jgi:AraC-like DNA-binding protein